MLRCRYILKVPSQGIYSGSLKSVQGRQRVHWHVHSIFFDPRYQECFLMLRCRYILKAPSQCIFSGSLKNILCTFFPSPGVGTKNAHCFFFLLSIFLPHSSHRHLQYCGYAGESSDPARWYAVYLQCPVSVSYTHLRAHETDSYLVCRLLLEKKKK